MLQTLTALAAVGAAGGNSCRLGSIDVKDLDPPCVSHYSALLMLTLARAQTRTCNLLALANSSQNGLHTFLFIFFIFLRGATGECNDCSCYGLH